MLRRALAVWLALLALAPATALAHEGDPRFSSEVTGQTPPGLEAQVLNYDDSLELAVDPGMEALVLGYEDEPYLRFRADGTVEVNRRSPARYLNSDRYADAEIPGLADAKAEPEWEAVAEHGRYAWHDHRIHWMSEGMPPQVDDESAEAKIFDWKVPVVADGERAALTGTLTWVGEDAGASPALIAGIGAAVLASLAFAVARIRRRNASADPGDGESGEAW